MISVEDHVKKTVRKTIETHNMLDNIRHVVLGFSGGPDSICLFDVLQDLSVEYGYTIHAVHVNHGIRETISDEEQAYCQTFCDNRAVDFRSYVYDCEERAKAWGISTEEAGRRLRYDAFLETALSLDSNPEEVAIAVAHNLEDQVETVIMRILRGTGVDGLAGIPYVRKLGSRDEAKFNVIRPLLDVARNDILEYCEDKQLNPRMDQTNQEPIYQRNRIRLELIPKLEEYNPAIKDAILRLSSSAAEDKEYLSQSAEALYKESMVGETDSQGGFDIEVIKSAEASVRKRLYLKALAEAGLNEDVAGPHLESIDNIVFSENPSAHVDLPKGYYAGRKYRRIVIGKDNGAPGNDVDISISEITGDEYRMMLDQNGKIPGKLYAAFDEGKLIAAFGENSVQDIVVRERRKGDSIKLSIGTKKLQDVLVDDKVPKEERDLLKVLAIGNNVLWMVLPEGKQNRWAYGLAADEDSEGVIFAEKIEK